MRLKNYLKSGLLLAVLGVLSITQSNAQTWTAPTYNGSVPVSGTTYYIYNVGSKGFLNRGAQWGTEACVSASPTANAAPATMVKWTATNVSGSTWTLMYNGTAAKYLFAASTDASGWVYTDGGSGEAINWTLAASDETNKIYTLQISSLYVADAGSQYLGSSSSTYTSNKGICNDVRFRTASGDNYTKWKFISQANYDLYQAKVVLNRYMSYAKAKGGIDLTSYISTYNADVTADIITAASNLLTALGPITVAVTNGSFESALGSEWTNTGTFVRQSNTPGMGWTKDGSQYCEKYTGSGGYLGTGSLTQTIPVPNGLYGLVVSGHAVQQAGANPLNTGAFIIAGSKSTEVASGGDYYVDSVSVTNGSITIGYSLQGTVQANWTGFDNFRLYRYATYATPSLSASASSLILDDIANSATFTVTGSNLTNPVTISAPTGITVNPTSLSVNPSSEVVTVTYDGSTAVNGNITLTSGDKVVNIAVKASSNASCFTPLYPSGNMIADPTFSALTLSAGGFGGWGPTGIVNEGAYCGKGSAFIRGACWPNGGSIDRSLTAANGNALKPSTTYRLRAMINSKASTGSIFQIVVEGVNVGGTNTIYFDLPATTGWEQKDWTFTTGAQVAEKGIYFNSCAADQGKTSPAITDTCFIDNYELYEVPSVPTSVSSANGQAIKTIYVSGDKVVAEFELAKSSDVRVSIYDIQGKLLVTSNNWYDAGFNKCVINSPLSQGAYVVKVVSDEFSVSKKVIK